MTDILSDDDFVRLFQQRAGLGVDGAAGRDTLAALDAAFPTTQATTDTRDTSGLPDDYWPLLAKIESAGRPYVKAATSSGSGLYQFLKATWIGEGGSWGNNPALAFGGLQPSTDEQTQRAKTFTAKNAAYLRSKGIPINKASLYAAHFFGPVTAAEVIGADVKARADAIAGPAATKANRSILENKTVGEFLTWLHGKTGEWAR
jgi:peptidoglycan hydrolase-like protein with peptidoglycan-binding domain